MLAIVDYKGNQIKMSQGREYNIPYFATEKGKKIIFDKVLMVSGDGITKIGTPEIKDAKVEATVVAEINSPKVLVLKFHSKKRYKKIGNHRQNYVRIIVDKIVS